MTVVPRFSAGIDIGGTKMLAQVFDGDMQVVAERRIATPARDYDLFISELAGQWRWIRQEAASVPIGVSLAGYVDPVSGRGVASNLPITGRAVAQDLGVATGEPAVIINDCDAFALSEAVDGAGQGAGVMIGLIIGTGMAAGLCQHGRLAPRGRAQAVEIGHVGMPHRALAQLELGLRDCGCGQKGCIERYVCGSGLPELGRELIGIAMDGEALAAGLIAGDAQAQVLFGHWCELVAEALSVIQMMNDPELIVIGGGLSALPGLIPALSDAFVRHGLQGMPRPRLLLAEHGGASGTRGAAFVALQHSGKSL